MFLFRRGGKGIIGIINSFIYKFVGFKACEIPEEYKKYFDEVPDLKSDTLISKEDACKAMIKKLKDEVYLRVELGEEELKQAKIGALTRYDINLPIGIDKSKIDIITDSNNKVLSAYDVAKNLYERAKNIGAIRNRHEDFFYMFEMLEKENYKNCNLDEGER